MLDKAQAIKDLLIKYGYAHAETILNEWNYVKGWTDEFIYTIKAIHSMKGAAFVMACICSAQKSDTIDMLMYYDTRPSVFNGMFDYYTYEKLKGYYSLYWYGMFYDMKSEIPAENSIENVYSLCGVDENGKVLSVVTYYTDDDEAADKSIHLDFGRPGSFEAYLVDETHSGELVATTDDLTFTLTRHSMLLIKEL